jgi:hypothetical protein
MARDDADKTDENLAALAFAKEFLNTNVFLNASRTHPITLPQALRLTYLTEAVLQDTDNPNVMFFDYAVNVAADMIRDGKPLPKWAASFVADVLQGKRKRPTKRGKKSKGENLLRDYALGRAVHEVKSKFDLAAYNNNDLSSKEAAADIVAKAAGVSLDVAKNAYRKFGDGGGFLQGKTTKEVAEGLGITEEQVSEAQRKTRRALGVK